MNDYASQQMTMNIIDMMSQSLHEEIFQMEKNLFEKLKIFEENDHSYKNFLANHDGPLFSEFGTQLNQMLKDIKILTAIKQNELATTPKSSKEFFQLSKKNLKPEQHSFVETDKFGNVDRVITPLTSNQDGYQLVEQRIDNKGENLVFLSNTAEEIFSHERKMKNEDNQTGFFKELPSPQMGLKTATRSYESFQSEASEYQYGVPKSGMFEGETEFSKGSDFMENDWIEGNLSIKRQSVYLATPETPIRETREDKRKIIITSAKRASLLEKENYEDNFVRRAEYESPPEVKPEVLLSRLKKSYEEDNYYDQTSNNTFSFKEELGLVTNNQSYESPVIDESIQSKKYALTNKRSQNTSKVEISPVKLMKESHYKIQHMTPSKSLQSSQTFLRTSQDPNNFFKSMSQTITIPLKFNQTMSIVNDNTLKVEDSNFTEIFSDVFHKPKIGINSQKCNQKVMFTKSKNECIFFNNKYQICALNLSIPGKAVPRYFMDEQVALTDFALDEIEQRVIILNVRGNLYYKNLFSDYLAEDQSLMNLGKIKGKAISISYDCEYLLIGYESDFFDGTHEDNLIIRRKSSITGYFEPFTAAYLSSLNGKLFFINFLNFF